MAEVRVSVEWIFGDVVNFFNSLDFRKIKDISAVGKIYITCALLHNAQACFYGSTTYEFFFKISPPAVKECFQWFKIENSWLTFKNLGDTLNE